MSAAQIPTVAPTPVALVARDVARTYPGADRPALDGVDLVASPGQRIGLVGENGSGKSTLLRILAGVDEADAGTVTRPAEVTYVAQEPAFAPGATVRDVLADALRPSHDAVRDLETVAARLADAPGSDDVAQAYDEALRRAESLDAWDADRRADVVADTLGLAAVEPRQPVDALSGGQRSRLAMAALLTRRAACVLLDEPTNHLDDAALDLVESSLAAWPGIVVAASHDRTFLDHVCTSLLDLDPNPFGTDGDGSGAFTGTFSEYEQARKAARIRWEETFADQQDELTRLRAATKVGTSAIAHNRGPRDNDKFIYNFKGARVDTAHSRRVRDAERRLAEAERDQVRKPPAPLHFAAPVGAATAAGPMIAVRDLDVPGRVRLPALDVSAGEHLLVTGPNGCGKSSLLAVLAGRLAAAPADARVEVNARRVALLPQEVAFERPERTALQTYVDAIGAERAERESPARWGLLSGRDLARPVEQLSVGQRSRLALALVVASGADLVLLDEPTNHLSPTLVGELFDAITGSSGTVLVASHDRWWRSRWPGRELLLTG